MPPLTTIAHTNAITINRKENDVLVLYIFLFVCNVNNSNINI